MNAAQVETPKFLLPRAIPKEQASKLRMVSHAEAMVAAAMEDSDGEFKWPPLIGQELAKLTPKQRQYTIRVAGGQPYFEAYRAAYDVSEGRSDKELYSDIGQLNNHPRISSVQLMLGTWLDRKWLLDAVEVKDYVSSVMYEQTITGDTSSARIKAGETLLRMHGLLVDKKEITHRDANELDEQSAILKSIMGDLSLGSVIEAEYVVHPQQLTGPTLGHVCSRCMSIENVVYEDGSGI